MSVRWHTRGYRGSSGTSVWGRDAKEPSASSLGGRPKRRKQLGTDLLLRYLVPGSSSPQSSLCPWGRPSHSLGSAGLSMKKSLFSWGQPNKFRLIPRRMCLRNYRGNKTKTLKCSHLQTGGLPSPYSDMTLAHTGRAASPSCLLSSSSSPPICLARSPPLQNLLLLALSSISPSLGSWQDRPHCLSSWKIQLVLESLLSVLSPLTEVILPVTQSSCKDWRYSRRCQLQRM